MDMEKLKKKEEKDNHISSNSDTLGDQFEKYMDGTLFHLNGKLFRLL